jgi:hypothetical protein
MPFSINVCLITLIQTAVNALLLWALCSNTFSLNEAAQASLKAKFKLSPPAAAGGKLKNSHHAAGSSSSVNSATVGGDCAARMLLNKLGTTGGGQAHPTPTQAMVSAGSTTAKSETDTPIDLRGQFQCCVSGCLSVKS